MEYENRGERKEWTKEASIGVAEDNVSGGRRSKGPGIGKKSCEEWSCWGQRFILVSGSRAGKLEGPFPSNRTQSSHGRNKKKAERYIHRTKHNCRDAWIRTHGFRDRKIFLVFCGQYNSQHQHPITDKVPDFREFHSSSIS